MSGAHSRRKGSAFERVLVQRFRDVMPHADVRRGLQFRSGAETPDVELPCFWLEAKHHQRVNIRAALKQARVGAPGGRWPVAVCKDDHEEPIVAMGFEDFLDLVHEWWKGRCT